MNTPKGHDLSGIQRLCLIILRTAIGWHMLSEGIGKFITLGWTAQGFLSISFGPFAWFFQWMLKEEQTWFLNMSNMIVMYGLIFVGLSLLLGCFTRLGCLVGLTLLTLFYVSVPPWEWVPMPGTESNSLIVNKNVIEGLGLLIVLVFPTGRFAGLDALLYPMIGQYFPAWIVGAPSKEA